MQQLIGDGDDRVAEGGVKGIGARANSSGAAPVGQVSAARQVGGEKPTQQVSETAKRAAIRHLILAAVIRA